MVKTRLKMILSFGLGILMLFLALGTLWPADVRAAGDDGSITVTAAYQDNGAYGLMPQTLKVKPGLAKEYGLDTAVDVASDKVSAMDVLVAAHQAKYGANFTKDTAKDYISVDKGTDYATVQKIFKDGAVSKGCCFSVNGVVSTDEYGDYSYPGSVAVTDGSRILFTTTHEQNNEVGDSYWFFGDASGKEINTQDAAVGKALDVSLQSKYFAKEGTPGYLDTIRIKAMKEDGSDTSDAVITYAGGGESTDTTGKATVTFNKTGTYILTVPGDPEGYLDNFVSSWCVINVKDSVSQVAVTKVTLDPGTLSLQTGKTAALTAAVEPADASDKRISWTSSDESVAAVDGAGQITAKGAGTATITAASLSNPQVTATCTVTVTAPQAAVTGVTLDQSTLSLAAGKQATLTATVSPQDAADKTVTWQTSDSKIATVKDGVVTAVAAGKATITAASVEDPTKQATCAVTVLSSDEDAVNKEAARYLDFVNKSDYSKDFFTVHVKDETRSGNYYSYAPYGTTSSFTTDHPELVSYSIQDGKLKKTVNASALTQDTPVVTRVTFTKGTASKTIEITGTAYRVPEIGDIAVTGIDGFAYQAGQSSYDLTYYDNSTHKLDLGIKVTASDGQNPDNLGLTIGGEAAAFGQSHAIQVDTSVESATVPIVITRKDKSTIQTTVTLNLRKYITATPEPAYTAFWGTGHHDLYNTSTVSGAKAPRTSSEVATEAQGSWHTRISTSGGASMAGWGKWTYPIVVNNNIYVAADLKIMKFDMDGHKLAEGTMSSSALGSGFTGWLSYGDGKIFVPSGRGVMAFNADDLTQLWTGTTQGINGVQGSSQILYHDGYVYTGTTDGGGYSGGYYCFKAEDKDTHRRDETNPAVWTFIPQGSSSFYWAGAAIVGDTLYVPCDSGTVYAIDLKASIAKQKAVIKDHYNADGGQIRGSVLYDETTGSLYYSTRSTTSSDQFTYKVALKADGSFDTTSVLRVEGRTEGCAAYNGRLYIGASVYDARTMKLIYNAAYASGADTTSKNGATICTTYATAANNQTVYVYYHTYGNPDQICVLADSTANNEDNKGTVQPIWNNLVSPEYNSSQVVIAQDGSLVFVNDSANLFCLKSKAGEDPVTPTPTPDPTPSPEPTPTPTPTPEPTPTPVLDYQAGSGTLDSNWQSGGSTSGTTGQGLKVTALRAKVVDGNGNAIDGLGVSYSVHLQNLGWRAANADGQTAGSGDLRVEALKMTLTGAKADQYDVYYRVHVQDIGWMNWAKNGDMAGTAGFAYQIEALQAVLVPKGGSAPAASPANNTEKSGITAENVRVDGHSQNIGWTQGWQQGNQIATATVGTTGQALRLEAFKLESADSGLQLHYQAHVQDIGWQKAVDAGATAGTTGQGLRLEALKIWATGDSAAKVSVQYRVHVQNTGWTDWVTAGSTMENAPAAGTTGQGLRIEALQVRTVEK